MVATTLFLVQGDQALPSSFIIGIDTCRSGISVLCVIIIVQSIAGEAEEDIPRKKKQPELAMFNTGSGLTYAW